MAMRINLPPSEFTPFQAEALQAYALALLRHLEMPEEEASLLARLLVDSDRRGVHSHGTWQLQRYVKELRSGGLNSKAVVQVLSDTTTVRVIDGDGGLGYRPAWLATQAAIAKAKEHGLGAATTRHHGHFGAAGHYSRACAAAGCIGIAASAVRHVPEPGRCIWWSASSPPISFAMPTGEQPSVVPDMGVYITDVSPENLGQLFPLVPDAFTKLLGLATFAQVLGGQLAGIYDYPPPERPPYAAANQGTFVLAMNLEAFLPPAEFRRQMDRYVAACRRLDPFPGWTQTELPGGLEWQRERAYARDGIPVSPQHEASLDAAAAAAGFPTLRQWRATSA